jgi:hypothetical protein
MQYVLGNMLNGGGINPDGLALDLQFAADKTLTARRGPTPTFTRGSTGTFVGSDGLIQSAAINTPRFDHDPVTLACKGLLIEEGRTNAFQHSSNFKDTTSSNYWGNQTATTITVDQIASPDGGVNADLLSTSTSSFDCFTRRGNFWAGSTQYTYSIFVKRGPSNYRYVGLYIGAGATALQFPYFDFDNPTTVQIPTITSGTINSTRVEAYPNGWYRIIITFTTAATPITLFGGVYISASNGALQGVNPAGNDCYIWGIQSELGSFPTSYIPTTTGTLARSADVCNITGGDFTSFYNQSEGTIIAAASVDVLAGNNRGIYGINNNTASHGFLTSYNAASSGIISQSRNTASTTLSPTFTNSAGVKFTRALAYYLGGCSIATNGSAVTDTAATISTQTMLTLQIGNMLGGSFQGTCHIPSIRYYRKRLPNAKLAQLTA